MLYSIQPCSASQGAFICFGSCRNHMRCGVRVVTRNQSYAVLSGECVNCLCISCWPHPGLAAPHTPLGSGEAPGRYTHTQNIQSTHTQYTETHSTHTHKEYTDTVHIQHTHRVHTHITQKHIVHTQHTEYTHRIHKHTVQTHTTHTHTQSTQTVHTQHRVHTHITQKHSTNTTHSTHTHTQSTHSYTSSTIRCQDAGLFIFWILCPYVFNFVLQIKRAELLHRKPVWNFLLLSVAHGEGDGRRKIRGEEVEKREAVPAVTQR